jgi:hypothetical protein
MTVKKSLTDKFLTLSLKKLDIRLLNESPPNEERELEISE